MARMDIKSDGVGVTAGLCRRRGGAVGMAVFGLLQSMGNITGGRGLTRNSGR